MKSGKKWFILLLLLLVLAACGRQQPEPVQPEEAQTHTEALPVEAPEPPEVALEAAEPPVETTRVAVPWDGGELSVEIPVTWSVEIEEDNPERISFRPGTETEGWLRLCYYRNGFGVCGTGLKLEERSLPDGSTVQLGYYDGREEWSFISSIQNTPDLALNVDGADWHLNYEAEILKLLTTVTLSLDP